MRPTGYIQELPGHLVTPWRLHPLARRFAGQTPASFACTNLAPVQDQRGGSCVAHGIATALYGSLGFVLSQRTLYATTRCLQAADDGKPPDEAIEDSGSYPNEAVRVAQTFGVCPMVAATPDEQTRQSDTADATINAKPVLSELEECGLRLSLGQYLVASPDALKVALQTIQRPVTLGIYVDSAFERWVGGPPILAPDLHDTNGGYHQLAIYGWAQGAAGADDVWLGQNSWGTGWGEVGRFRASTAWLAAAFDIYAWPDVHVLGAQR